MRAKTQVSEINQHLCIQLPQILTRLPPRLADSAQTFNNDAELETNFGYTVNHPFSFILLHLRNKHNKNVLYLNIPEVCIFRERSPLDIVYASKGYIRGLKNNEHGRLRLKELNKFFKECWSSKNMPKNETSVAAFAAKQMLMLSDNDLFLVCCKAKSDSFFKKLHYIRNKLPASDYPPIKVSFPVKENTNLLRMATQSLLGLKLQSQIQQCLSEQEYLRYLNEKISMVLNSQHNIRISKCDFYYIRTNDNDYYLVNVENLKFSNLTKALEKREKWLAQRQEERDKILIMTPEKEKRYKSYESAPQVKIYEQMMGTQFNNMVRKLNLNTISDNKREEVKNELAFKKLHPKAKYTYTEVITSSDFLKIKAKVFNTPNRKPLTVPSRHVQRFYNKIRDSRIKTETTDAFT